MIVLENVLEEIFSYLPDHVTNSGVFTPTFASGDAKELNAFLKAKHKATTSFYPLIWLLYPYTEKHEDKALVVDEVTLILAVQTNSSMQNRQRLNETYAKVLIPLFDNIRHCFKSANIINTDSKYVVVKHPNFSDDESLGGSHAGALIWDAMKVKIGLRITDTCLQPIRF